MLDFLYYAVSWVLLRWHELLTFLGLDSAGGLNWAISIILLVVTARLLLFRLFVKQVHSQRRMQEMQPKIQALRDKHKGDRATLQQEMMKLQQEEGFNPVAGCLPLVLTFPVFIGLFHTLRHLANSADIPLGTTNTSQLNRLTLYGFTKLQTFEGAHAKLFGAPLASSFRDNADAVRTLGGDPSTYRWVILPLLLISAAATYMTQRLVQRNATTPAVGQAALIQKVMLYIIPLGVLGSGLLFQFPLGVLLYWFTNNSWTMLQQLYIQRFHAAPVKDEPVVGERGKALAPKPGAKPVDPRTRRSAAAAAETATPDDPAAPPAPGGRSTGGGARPVSSARSSPGARPAPGARPSNRPPARRSGQRSKKR